MRKFIFSVIWSLILVFCMGELSLAQDNTPYKWSHQSPQGNTIRWIKRWDANNWYAVGYAGTFMKTTNAGANWSIKTLINGVSSAGANLLLYDAHFLDMNTGVVAGSSGRVARTTNGGTTWDTTTTSSSGTVYDVFMVNATTGYLCGTTSVRVSKTTDGGATWAFAGDITSLTYYSVFAADANTIYAGTSTGTFYKSTDAGATWAAQTTTGTGIIYAMRFMDANTGYVVGSSNKVSMTTNGGTNWTSLTGSITGTFYDIDFNSSTLPPPTLNQEFTDVTFPPTGWTSASLLGAKVWNRSTTSAFSAPACALSDWETTGGYDWLITNSHTVYAGDSLSFQLRRSYTGAAFNWDSLQVYVGTSADTATMTRVLTIGVNALIDTTGSTYPPRLGAYQRYAVNMNSFAGQNVFIAFRHLNSDGTGVRMDNVVLGENRPASQNVAYVTGNNQFIYTAAFGSNAWDTLGFLNANQPWTSTYYSSDLSSSGDTILTAGAFGLINCRFSASNRAVYTDFIKAGSFYAIWADSGSANGRVICVGAPGIAGSVFDQVMYSTNGGADWQLGNYSATDDQDLNSISMINNMTGYVAGDEGLIAKTTDGGANWNPTAGVTGLTTELNKAEFVNVNTGYVFGTSGQGHKTTDGGGTWTTLTTGMGTSTIYGAGFIDANTGWIVGASGKIFMTTDGGATFTQQVSNYGSTFNAMSMINASTGYVVGLSGTVRKTTNGGTNWDTTNVPFTSSLYGIHFFNANTGTVVGAGGVVYRTTDGGATWEFDNTGGSTQYGVSMPNPYASFINGLNANVFKYDNPPSGNGTFTNNVPEKYFLDQNYPNPFNPSTTIKFGLPREGNVSLKIYDMAGREVANIFNNQRINAGQVSYRFDGSRLASGVYFYSLIVDNDLIATKKMVLIK